MTYIYSLLLSISITYTLVYFGHLLERRWRLSRYYISPPLVGGGIGALFWLAGTQFFDIYWVPHPSIGDWLVANFLFFVGFKIGLIYKKHHIRSLVIFSAFAAGLMLVFEIPAWLFFNRFETAFTAFGSVSFAWNEEWLSYIRFEFSEAEAVSYTSLLLIFIVTPVMIFLMNSRLAAISTSPASLPFKEWHIQGALMIGLSTLIAMWMKHEWLADVMFVFVFVFSMGIGFGAGFLSRKKLDRLKPTFMPTIAEIGKLSLNGFIVFMLLKATEVVWLHGNWRITVYLFVKIICVSFILIVWTRIKVKNHKQLVWASAIWAFSLSAPVACMNAMRSVVERHGEADDVVFIVPPVILWLINYPHYFIYAWIHGL